MQCLICQKRSYSDYCVQHKPRKRINPMGKRTLEYNEWRDTVAIPYLDATYGRICATPDCMVTTKLDVQHKQKRGSHPELKMNLNNVEYLCRTHHIAIT